MSGTEILIILVIGIIVVGPKKLPGMMRTAGRYISKARRMTTEVRASSGIDKLIREEGLENEIRELSSLSRSNMLSSLVNPLTSAQRAVTDFARSPVLPAATAVAAAKPAVAELGAGEPASSSSDAATHLIKPAVGNVARKSNDEALRALAASGLFSIREREYPTMGCDHYDVLPDDIDDPEAYADDPVSEAVAPAVASPSVEAPPSALVTPPVEMPPPVEGQVTGEPS